MFSFIFIFFSGIDLLHKERNPSVSICICGVFDLTLLHSEWPKLYGVLAVLSAIGLKQVSVAVYR